MSEIQFFSFQNNEVRVVLDENKEPWWVATDVAKILDYRNAPDMVRRLDDDEKGTRSVRTLGGEQKLTVINEPGLYSAILGSKKPEAREFKRWVTHELLPTVRKYDAYLTDKKIEEVLTNPDTIIRIATQLKQAKEQQQKLQQQIEADKPKVLFADAVSTSNSHILVGELAKILKGNGINVGGLRLFDWMRNNGFLISRRGTDWNMPTQKSMELKLFRIKQTAVTHSDGHVTVTKTPKVTPKGQQYFIQRFLEGTFIIEEEEENNE